jgi:PAS domain S-box-containing protein
LRPLCGCKSTAHPLYVNPLGAVSIQGHQPLREEVASIFEFGAFGFAMLAVTIVAVISAVWLLRDAVRAERMLKISESRSEDLSDRLFAAAESLERQRQLIENQGDLVVRRDLAGVITMANAAFAQAAGQSLDALCGTRFDFAGARVAAPGADHLTERYDQAIRFSTGERWFAWSVIPVKNREGSLVEHYAVGRDITERRRAEAASEAKSRFLATVSHEVRTPLNGVLGMADLLRDTALEPEQATYVSAIKTSGEALLSLIDEILDFSKIEAGKADIASDRFDVHQVAEGVIELLAPRAQGKGIEIALSISPGTPRLVVGDGARVRQVLLNLAGNAVKFTESGGVGVAVSADVHGITIEVMDTGPGIAADRLEAIFAEFEQADGSGAHRNEGTGLGLAISRRLIERMGGSILVESEPGVGSRFVMQLPLRVAVGGAPDAPPQLEMTGQKVLLATNGPFEGRFLVERLSERGADVHLVKHVDTALAELAQTAFDLAIIDCGFGPEETRQLGAAVRSAARTQALVLLSPYERRSFGSPAEAGFDGYLVKPVRSRSLYARLTPASAPAPVGAALPALDNSAAPQAFHVLLAEDNDINALLATRTLERLGAKVTWAKDGVSALALALASINGTAARFDAAFLDVRMPGMDGKTVVARIRAVERTVAGLPMRLAAITANAFAEDREACLACGFDAFIPKPLNREAMAQFLWAKPAVPDAGSKAA